MDHLPVGSDSPVFIRITGDLVLPSTVSHYFLKVCKRLGIHNVSFHDLRHSHATLMLMQGVHPKVVQERLGHSKISTTMDIYSHVMPNLQKEAAEKFDLALEPTKEKPFL